MTKIAIFAVILVLAVGAFNHTYVVFFGKSSQFHVKISIYYAAWVA